MAKVRCPKCQFTTNWKLSDGRRKCCRCRSYFKPRISYFRLSNYHTNHLIEYFCLGVPIYRLRLVTPVSRQTIGKFFRFLRQLIFDQLAKELEETKLAGPNEMDETMFGGKRKGKRGWGAIGKKMVFGIYKRNGKVIVFQIPNRSRQTITDLIFKHTAPGSLCYTDEWHAYTYLSIRNNHVVVRKDKGRPQGRDHINGIEGFWSYAKHWLYQYRGVPQKYFHLYLKETEWRFNHRDDNLIQLIKQLVKEHIGADI